MIKPYNELVGLERFFKLGRQPARREVAFSFPGIPRELQGDPDVLLAQAVLSDISNLHGRMLSGEQQPASSETPLYSIDMIDYDKKETREMDVYFDPGSHRPAELTMLSNALWERIADPRKVGEIRPYLRAVARKLRTQERKLI